MANIVGIDLSNLPNNLKTDSSIRDIIEKKYNIKFLEYEMTKNIMKFEDPNKKICINDDIEFQNNLKLKIIYLEKNAKITYDDLKNIIEKFYLDLLDDPITYKKTNDEIVNLKFSFYTMAFIKEIHTYPNEIKHKIYEILTYNVMNKININDIDSFIPSNKSKIDDLKNKINQFFTINLINKDGFYNEIKDFSFTNEFFGSDDLNIFKNMSEIIINNAKINKIDTILSLGNSLHFCKYFIEPNIKFIELPMSKLKPYCNEKSYETSFREAIENLHKISSQSNAIINFIKKIINFHSDLIENIKSGKRIMLIDFIDTGVGTIIGCIIIFMAIWKHEYNKNKDFNECNKLMNKINNQIFILGISEVNKSYNKSICDRYISELLKLNIDIKKITNNIIDIKTNVPKYIMYDFDFGRCIVQRSIVLDQAWTNFTIYGNYYTRTFTCFLLDLYVKLSINTKSKQSGGSTHNKQYILYSNNKNNYLVMNNF